MNLLNILFLTFLLSTPVFGDGGSFQVQNLKEFHEELKKSKTDKDIILDKILETKNEKVYIHITHSCCSSGNFSSGASIIKVSKNEFEKTDISYTPMGKTTYQFKNPNLILTETYGPSRFETNVTTTITNYRWDGSKMVKENRSTSNDSEKAKKLLDKAKEQKDHKKFKEAISFLISDANYAYDVGHSNSLSPGALKYFEDLANFQVRRSLKLLKSNKKAQALSEIKVVDQLEFVLEDTRNKWEFIDESFKASTYQIYNDLGFVFYRLGMYKKALSYLEFVMLHQSSRKPLYLNLYEVYNALNKKEQAKTSLKVYISLMIESNKTKRIPTKFAKETKEIISILNPCSQKDKYKLLKPIQCDQIKKLPFEFQPMFTANSWLLKGEWFQNQIYKILSNKDLPKDFFPISISESYQVIVFSGFISKNLEFFRESVLKSSLQGIDIDSEEMGEGISYDHLLTIHKSNREVSLLPGHGKIINSSEHKYFNEDSGLIFLKSKSWLSNSVYINNQSFSSRGNLIILEHDGRSGQGNNYYFVNSKESQEIKKNRYFSIASGDYFPTLIEQVCLSAPDCPIQFNCQESYYFYEYEISKKKYVERKSKTQVKSNNLSLDQVKCTDTQEGIFYNTKTGTYHRVK